MKTITKKDHVEQLDPPVRAGRHRFSACLFLGLYAITGCTAAALAPASSSQQVQRAPKASTRVESKPAPAPGGQWESDRYTDLPIPRDYEFNSDESFVFEQEGIRNADLKYVGPMKVDEIIRFYRDAMPSSGWQFNRMSGVRMKTITFTKGGEMCEIIIMSTEPAEGKQSGEWLASAMQTHLHIKLNAY